MREAQADGVVSLELLTQVQRHAVVAVVAAAHLRRIALLVFVVKVAALLQARRNRPAQAADVRALVVDFVVVRLPRARVEVDLRAVFFRLFRDDVDDAADRIAAVERRACAFHDFDALDVLHGRDARERRARAAHRALIVVEALAVDHDDDALLAIDAHDLVVAARAIRHDDARHMVQRLGDVGVVIRLDVLRRDDGHIRRRAHGRGRNPLRRHDRLAEIRGLVVCFCRQRRAGRAERPGGKRGQDGIRECLFLHRCSYLSRLVP